MINKTLGNIFKGDKVIWMVFFFLCLISVIEVYSASAQLTYKAGSYIAPMVKHIGLLCVGVFFTVLTLNVKCRYFVCHAYMGLLRGCLDQWSTTMDSDIRHTVPTVGNS